MTQRRASSRRQIRRRRAVAAAVLALIAVAAAYLVLASTVLAPVDRHGARLVHLHVQSRAVGRELGVNVIVPPRVAPRGDRPLLIYLHGRGGYEGTFNDAVFRGLPTLHGHRGVVVAFPAGGVHGYWHNRSDGDWDTYVVGTVESDPDAFGQAHVWIDYGSEDPFRVYDEGFVSAMEAGNADLTAHSWPGAHEGGYWDAHWPAYQQFYVHALEHCD